MMFLTGISCAAFVFVGFVLFWWHPNSPLDTRVALAGIYILIGTVATLGAALLPRLDALLERRRGHERI
jgi:hypothetical protein